VFALDGLGGGDALAVTDSVAALVGGVVSIVAAIKIYSASHGCRDRQPSQK
jgi:hypothetical protein